MTTSHTNFVVLDILSLGRRVADYAESIGFSGETKRRPKFNPHLGAVLADAILQAGVNYRTVVKPRVERIVRLFPESANLSGTMKIVEANAVGDFLLWKHSEKVERFTRLHDLLQAYRVQDTCMLQRWLLHRSRRSELLQVKGIGPKTVDYLSCLVGIDSVAIDRHVRDFAKQAGVDIRDYEQLRTVFCCAADLLGTPRRDFDAWVWANRAQPTVQSRQYELF